MPRILAASFLSPSLSLESEEDEPAGPELDPEEEEEWLLLPPPLPSLPLPLPSSLLLLPPPPLPSSSSDEEESEEESEVEDEDDGFLRALRCLNLFFIWFLSLKRLKKRCMVMAAATTSPGCLSSSPPLSSCRDSHGRPFLGRGFRLAAL